LRDLGRDDQCEPSEVNENLKNPRPKQRKGDFPELLAEVKQWIAWQSKIKESVSTSYLPPYSCDSIRHSFTMPPVSTPRITPGARTLQDRLHDVLSRLSSTIELVKSWPESTDASVHVESTSRLIASIRQIITALQSVEATVRNDAELRQSLQSLLIPLDLLELLDNALNPDCFSRGLLKEAIGQFAGLKRRKWALEMLGASVQKGLDERIGRDWHRQNEQSAECTTSKLKREHVAETETDFQYPSKKQKLEQEVD
jgi:Transcription factor subunit Med10 of Mediator complex